MTTTDADGNNATSTPTPYPAGLGAVASYPTNSSQQVTAPGSTDVAPAKYTAGNQVQSAWYRLVEPTDGTTTPSAGLIGSYLTGTPATSSSNSNVTVSNLTSSSYTSN